jgi:hypothetical protein
MPIAALAADVPDKSDQTPVAALAPQSGKARSELTIEQTRRNVMSGRSIVVEGTLDVDGISSLRSVGDPVLTSRTVRLQVRFRSGWRTVDRDRTNAEGAYRLKWRPRGSGTRHLRVSFIGDAVTEQIRRTVGRAHVYRRALASWYGPGLYGNRLSCGGRLMPGTIGVAHKTLPCGTKVTLRYKGRVVRARVIDRGPYVGAREFDLTAATKAKLRFGSTGSVLVSA